MKTSVFRRMPSLVKLAAALLVAAVLIGTGWAAEKIYKLVTSEYTVISHRTLSGTTEFGTNDPNPAEKEKQSNEEIKQLVAQKKYKFVRTIHYPQGNESNVYYFYLSDGSRLKWKSGPPRFEEVTSWDEYERKSQEYSEQRGKDIEKAIASGKGRLINILVTEIQVCRDVESGQKLDVRRYVLPEDEGDDVLKFYRGGVATLYPGGMENADKPGTHMLIESSWQDHLQAIRDGRRELLDIRLVKQGVYEVVREDGSKLVFSRELPPQEKPEAKQR